MSLRRRWHAWLAVSAGSLIVLLAILWLALPGILKNQAERFVQDRTGHALSMAMPEFNPLALRLTLARLDLTTPDGARLVAFDSLVVDLSLASLARASLVFDEIRLDGLDLTIGDLADGSTNWTPLLGRLQGTETASGPSGALPRLDIDRLSIARARLTVSDQRAGRDFHTRFEPIEISLSNLNTVANEEGQFSLAATLDNGATLALDATASMQPIQVAGTVSLKAFDLETLAPYVKDAAPVNVSGRLELGAHYRARIESGQIDLALAQMSLALAPLHLTLSSLPGAGVDIERVSANNGHFDLLAHKAGLEGFTVENARVRLPALKEGPRLGKLAVEQIRVALDERLLTVDKIGLSGGSVRANRSAEGQIDLLAARDQVMAAVAKGTPARRATAAPAPTEAPAAPAVDVAAATPWRYQIAEVAFDDWNLALRDAGTSPPAELGVHKAGLSFKGVSDDLRKPVPMTFSASVGTTGQLRASGVLTPAAPVAPAAEMSVSLSNLGLPMFQPYVAAQANAVLANGRVSAQGKLSVKPAGDKEEGVAYAGDFQLSDLRINEADSATPILAWKHLRAPKLRVTPSRLDIAELQLSGLDTQLIINKDKTTNIGKLRRQPPAPASAPASDLASAVPPASTSGPTGASAASIAASQPGKGNPFIVNVARLRFDDGELEFADHSLVLPFGTRIHELQGSVSGLTSRPGRYAQLELEGAVDDFGVARASGQVDVFNPTGFLDVAVSFRNVDMPRLSPYTATFAGRRIDTGKLSLELQYKIKDRQLHGDNKVIIDRLTLGERVESPTAKDLPLSLAIALLEDSDGRIDLGLPVSGNLDDPQFSYGAIVWKAIVNVLTKVVTAPFRAIGALFGSEEPIEGIVFEAGVAKLSPPEREKLVRVSSALAKRPSLVVGVRGIHTAADKVALQDRQLRRLLLAAMGDPVPPEGDPGPVTTDHPKVRAELESLYAKRTSGADLAGLKEGFRQANPGQLAEGMAGKMMSRLTSLVREKKPLSDSEIAGLKGADFYTVLYERVRALEPIPDERLSALALGRAQYAYDQLKTLGVAEARLRLEPPQRGEHAETGIPLALELAPGPGQR